MHRDIFLLSKGILSGVVLRGSKRLPPNDKDVGSNPAATRNKQNRHWETVWTGSQWKTSDVKPN